VRSIRPVLLLVVAFGCSTSEYTGRRQLLLVDEKTEAQLGRQAYQQALTEQPISRDPAEVEPLRRVGRRVAEAAQKPEYQWEFNVIDDDRTVNAWCLPGGKIAFYTGIFPVLEDEAGMAFVMAHEVSHALLRHGAERMSQNMVAGGAGALLNVYLGVAQPEYQDIVMAAFGVGVGVGILLPYSRKHESEADAVGLELMAKAGYDPRQAVEVWKRMSRVGGAQPPEFLSTHPSHETRIQDLEERMPEALALFQKAPHAPIARLPGPNGRSRDAATPGALAAGVAARAGAPRRETLEDGQRAVHLPVVFEEDVYVREGEVRSPSGNVTRFEARSGISAGETRYLLLRRRTEFEPGRYTATFRGTSTGRPFTASIAYDLR
jgi:Zn-dependent protease with chaperone function